MEVKLATTSSVFGAALASMLVAPELQADVVSLTFTPDSQPFNFLSNLYTVQVDPGLGYFRERNDPGFRGLGYWNGVLSSVSLGFVSKSDSLVFGQTFGGNHTVSWTQAASGTYFVGFNSGGNVGWFTVTLDGFQGAMHFGPGQYGNAGESVHVPSPGALALLALGAVGIRRKRKRVA